MDPDEKLIRERAYAIWLREGCPTDAADRHWRQAKEELDAPQPDKGEEGEEGHATLVAGPEARSDDKP